MGHQINNTRNQHLGVPPQQPQNSSQQHHRDPNRIQQAMQSQGVHAPPPQPPGMLYNPHSYQNGMHMPPYMSHLHYSSGSGSHPFPVIMTDDLVSGTQHQGRMSPVRRFFLLLCTFDILFTCLLWVIAILVTGNIDDIAIASYQNQFPRPRPDSRAAQTGHGVQHSLINV